MVLSTILPSLSGGQMILVLLVLLVLSYYVFRWKDNRNLAPGPLSLPIVGTLLTFAIKASRYTAPFRALGDWRSKYGDIFRIRFGPQEAVVISGYKLVIEALRDHHRVFETRAHIPVFDAITRGCGIVCSNGKMWLETRKFAAGALREMGVGKKSLEQHIQEETRFLIDRLDTGGTPLNPRSIAMKATSNVVLRICFGERSDYEDAEFCEMIRNLDINLKNVGIQLLENFWPWIEYVPPLARLPILKAAVDVVLKYTMRRVLHHKATYDDAHTRDLTDLHLKQRQQWPDERMKTDYHACRTVMDLFVAGTDTSAANLSWSILYMIHFPDIQTKCRQEIEKVVGSGRMVLLSDEPALIYNRAVINEIMRHATFTPLGVPRGVTEDVEIGGYIVPKGAMAIFDLDSVHRDKRHWGEDADEFRPERWIDEHGQLRTFDGFMPFCIGSRQCVGKPLALMEAFLFFTNTIQRLIFKLPDGAPMPELEGIQSGVTQIPQDYCFVSERI